MQGHTSKTNTAKAESKLNKLNRSSNSNFPRRVIPGTRKLFWNDFTRGSIITVRRTTIIMAIVFFALLANGFTHISRKAFADSGSGGVTFSVEVPTDSLIEVKLFNPDGTNMGNTASMDVVPSMFKAGFNEKEVVVSVGTNNEWGYNLMMNIDNTSLVSNSDSNNTIPSLAERDAAYTCTPETADTCDFTLNSWGFQIKEDTNSQSATNGYIAIPSSIELNRNDTITNGDPAHILFGSKVNASQAAGAYSTTINFVATANPDPDPSPKLTFDANGGTFAGGATTNVLKYSVPEVIHYTKDTKTTSTTNSASASGTHKSNINDPLQYYSGAAFYYQDLTLNTDAPGPYDLTINYALVTNSALICVLEGNTYTPKSYEDCINPDANALAPTSDDGDLYQDVMLFGIQSGGETSYVHTATYKLYNKTARILFQNIRGSSYGFWAEFTGGGDVVAQDLISGTYIDKPADRSGYVFLGWATTPNATEPNWTYNPNAIVEENTTIYAVWIKVDGTMQDFTCSTLASGGLKLLVDTRDDNIYWVSKLADGKCWMLDNLRLGGSSAITLHNTDTNISASSWSLPASGTANFTSSTGYTTAAINTASIDTTQTQVEGSLGSGKIGVYYNYCAASAGTYCYPSSSSTGNAEHDICPKGWRMPTGGDSGEYQALYKAYSSNATDYKKALSLPLSGVFGDGSAHNQGSYGFFWSSTRYNGTYMYYLSVNSSSVNPQNYDLRYLGRSVRCVSSGA